MQCVVAGRSAAQSDARSRHTQTLHHVGAKCGAASVAQCSAVGADSLDRRTEPRLGDSARAFVGFRAGEMPVHKCHTHDVVQTTKTADGNERRASTASSDCACADRTLGTRRRMSREQHAHLARVVAAWIAGETDDHTSGMSHGVDHVSTSAC